MPPLTFWQRFGGALIGAGAMAAAQLLGGAIALGMVLQQVSDLRDKVQSLEVSRLEDARSLVRSETRLDAIDRSLASIERMLGNIVQAKLP